MDVVGPLFKLLLYFFQKQKTQPNLASSFLQACAVFVFVHKNGACLLCVIVNLIEG